MHLKKVKQFVKKIGIDYPSDLTKTCTNIDNTRKHSNLADQHTIPLCLGPCRTLQLSKRPTLETHVTEQPVRLLNQVQRRVKLGHLWTHAQHCTHTTS